MNIFETTIAIYRRVFDIYINFVIITLAKNTRSDPLDTAGFFYF